MSFKALNDNMWPEGLLVSALVFGEYPFTRVFGEPLVRRPTSRAHPVPATEAQRKMEYEMNKMRTRRALCHRVPRAADVTFEVGDQVLVWRERPIADQIGEWTVYLILTAYKIDKSLVCVSSHN